MCTICEIRQNWLTPVCFVAHNYQSIIFLGDGLEYWSTEGRGCSYQGLYQLQYLGAA